MFAAVAIVAVLLSIVLRLIAPAQQQRAAVQMVERMGGSVEYASVPSGESWPTSLLRAWLPRDYFDPVVAVDFYLHLVTDDHFAPLARLKQLQEIRFNLISDKYRLVRYRREVRLTNAALVHLQDLQQLRHLNLAGSRVTDEGIMNLQNLQQLQTLRLDHTAVTSAGVESLREEIPYCRISR